MKKPPKRKPKQRRQPVQRTQAARPRPAATWRPTLAAARWLTEDADRSAMMVLMMPVLLMAFALSAMQTTRRALPSFDSVYERLAFERADSPVISRPQVPDTQRPAPVVLPEPSLDVSVSETVTPESATVDGHPDQVINRDAPAVETGADVAADVADVPTPEIAIPQSEPVVVASAMPDRAETDRLEPEAVASSSVPVGEDPAVSTQAQADVRVDTSMTSAQQTELAMLARPDLTDELNKLPPVAITPPPPAVCVPAPRMPEEQLSGDPGTFGARLAAAARAQLDNVVIYTARYRHLSYPMGDLPSLHGACSDLVVRAYRALGVDLQELVQRARLGRDQNIDHRRTETLRRLFTRYGQSLPVSRYAEDYEPGDVVTYYRPFSRVSRAHIAIVADILAPSGRPMIIHNRGWGPQLEDALFSDQITGHYRFHGASGLTIAGTPASAGRSVLRLQKASFGLQIDRQKRTASRGIAAPGL